VAAFLVSSVALGLGVPADAVPAYPSQVEVDAAAAAASAKAAQVKRLQNQLAAANDRLEEAQVAAQIAVEDYNEAVERLKQATALAEQTKAAAEQARAELQTASQDVANLAVETYRQGTASLGLNLEAVLSSAGPQQLIDRADAASYLGEITQNTYVDAQQAQATSELADQQAAAAETDRQAAADAAEAARQEAQRKEDAAAALVASTARERASTVAQLAVLNNTTAQLQQQRQEGIEAERRAAAEEAARQEAARREAAAREQAAREAAARQAAAEAAARQAAAEAAAQEAAQSGGQAVVNVTISDPAPSSSSGGSSEGSSSAGEAAVEWARTQIGKPYEWGATGPDSYDCSGLSQAAWAHAGVSLPRVSRDQYRAVEHIPYSELRPGDLIFYGSGNNASTVHHVAIYSGNGRMIEAPRTGLDLRETSLRMSGSMDYAGRP
jgi:cell wall-associated NlpC family hydrolase